MALLLPPVPGRLPWGVTRGLTARYPLDDSSVDNALRDVVGSNHALHTLNTPYGIDGVTPVSRSRKYGTTTTDMSYWTTPPIPQTGWIGTVSFWLWLDSLTTAGADGDPRVLPIGTTTDLLVAIVSGVGTLNVRYGAAEHTGTNLPLSTFQMISFSFDGSALKVYLNASDITVAAGLGDTTNAGQYSFMGRRSGAGTGDRQPMGRMQDLRFYTGTVLTRAEIAQLYFSAFTTEEIMPAMFLPAAGGSFLAAWAMQSNLPVLGTGTY